MITKTLDIVEQEARLAKQVFDETPRMWWALWCHKNAVGTSLDFTSNAWLRNLYLDTSERIVIPKSSKTYITEWMIADMLSLALKGLNGMYILPDQPIRNRFVTSRVDAIIRKLPEMNIWPRKLDKSVHEKGLKTLFNSTWAFVGAKNPDTFYEFDADVLLIDEYDKCNPISLATSADRTLAATKERWRKVGNPTNSGLGIEKEYTESDQKVWLIQCEHCNYWQELDWFVNFVEKIDDWTYLILDSSDKDINPICQKCKRSFDRLGHGEWVAKHLNNPISGYRVSRLFWSPPGGIGIDERPPMREMYRDFTKSLNNKTTLQLFYNNRLGLPYDDHDDRLFEEDLRKCVSPHCLRVSTKARNEGATVVAGVDQGKRFHIVATVQYEKREWLFFVGTARDWDQLETLLEGIGVDYVCVDAQGGGYAETRKFIAAEPGRAMAFYVGKDKVSEQYKFDDETGVIHANRTESIDVVVSRIKSGMLRIPQDWESICDGELKSHFLTPCRVIDPTGRPVWTKGNDHLLHAYVYATLARQAFGAETLGQEYEMDEYSWTI